MLNKTDILYRLEAEDLTVRTGSNFSCTDGQEYNVSIVVAHLLYAGQYQYDIALLKTTTKMFYNDRTKHINLSVFSPDANLTAVISGYGGNEVSLT